MPWVVAGSPGVVDITWLGSPSSPNTFPSAWYVFFAQTTNALSATPTFNQVQVLAKSIHDQDICFNGSGCADNPRQSPGNRDLLEYYTMTIDPDGNANIAFPDSLTQDCPADTCINNTWYTKQTSGSNAYAPPAPPAAAPTPCVGDCGHNGVVLAVAVCLPGTGIPILALPLLARRHLPGQGQPRCADLTREMLSAVLAWWPQRRFTLVGDGAYATKGLLMDLDERVTFVGRLRGDAAVYDPRVPLTAKSRRGRKAKKGERLPKPKEAAAKADRKRTTTGDWVWQDVAVSVYGCARSLKALAYEVVWPTVLGYRAIQVVVVRDPSGRMRDCYLFTTDLQAGLSWVITMFAWRWAMEVLFRASKQVMDIEGPQQWSQESVEKLAPWVWSMQSVVMVWYITAGYESAEAAELRGLLGEWDSEWSLRHMMQVLRRAILNATIDPNSANEAELREMAQTLKNWANLAA